MYVVKVHGMSCSFLCSLAGYLLRNERIVTNTGNYEHERLFVLRTRASMAFQVLCVCVCACVCVCVCVRASEKQF